ncbi:CRISPR-associated helicase Cas3' [Oceanobacillus massiliensis]|uniref:CRISPR-associated helicase Cas3' n=1 Tax=Oceanobacillus massiliensis TaxID=1465765 RepID=UPI00301AAA1D
MNSIAHIREIDSKIQTVKEHLLEVRDLAESYGEKIGIKHVTGLAGLLHDLGKYTFEFRTYILDAVNNPEAPPKRGSVDHSTAGGKLLHESLHSKEAVKRNIYKGVLAEVTANAIISHHSYLQDFLNPELDSNYLNRVQNKELPEFEYTKQQFFSQVMRIQDFEAYVDKAATEIQSYLEASRPEDLGKEFMFLTKFVFSALIDADRTNTRLFEENKEAEPEPNHRELFQTYYQRLMNKIDSFQNKSGSDSPINMLRKQMSDKSDEHAEKASGIYTLSIPTGGGKTLASLRYALKHGKLHNKERIIYVVPYTTIIEQNAKEVRDILKDDSNILEHHSNVIEDDSIEDELQDGMINTQQKLKLAKDSWDSPIIFTTMVQFLNVFYAKGSRNIRRLHNLSESIIIFDEVQKVPTSCISLFNQALNFLKNKAHCSIVLCTATQPALDFVEHKLAIAPEAEIIDNLETVINAFKRVEIIDEASQKTYNNQKLTGFVRSRLKTAQSILVILNTKKVVKDLYLSLKDENLDVPLYHLSTSMCAAHRNDILEKVRNHLSEGQPVICISTQLIEAGVDVSFDCVIRSLAGLDSIAQAAGRCNRHGEKDIQNVYIIDHEEENLSRLKEIEKGKQVTRRILVDIQRNPEAHGGSILSKQAMDRYFKEFYTEFKADLNYPVTKLDIEMTELLSAPRSAYRFYNSYRSKYGKNLDLIITNSYKTAAENFHVISNQTTSVIVPYGNAKEIIAELNSNQSIEDLSAFLKRAQQYTISIYEFEKEALSKNGGMVSYLDGNVLALKDGSYSEEFGLVLENDGQLDSLVF